MLKKLLLFVWTILLPSAWAALDVSLNRSQYISYSLLSRPRNGIDNDILLLFRTIQPSAILFYITGTTGDFLSLELVRGKLRYAATVGTTGERDESAYQEIIVGDNLADNQWHQVEVTRRKESTYVVVDVIDKKSKTSPSKLTTVTLDNTMYVGGLPPSEWKQARRRLFSNRNFSGCLSDIQLDHETSASTSLDLLHLAKTTESDLMISGSLSWNCSLSAYVPINFPNKDSYMQVPRKSIAGITVEFLFRTYQRQGLLFTNEGNHLTKNQSRLSIFLDRNQLHMSIQGQSLLVLQPEDSIDDGMWHSVKLLINKGATTFQVDDKKAHFNLKGLRDFDFGHIVYFGTSDKSRERFVGCMLNVSLDLSPVDFNTISGENITLNQCRMVDRCFPNPCNNEGRCIQWGNKTTCDCTSTEYSGKYCEKREYEFKKSCLEYYESGFRHSGRYKIQPSSLPPFVVRCNMSTPFGPMTIVEHDHQNPVTVSIQQDSKSRFYYHPMRYMVDLMRIEGLVDLSAHCRQFLRYNCYSSTLMYSSDPYLSERNSYGARWYSRNGDMKNYWGGSSPGSFKCKCGMTGECVEKKLACNCDKQDKVWRSDEGYVTNKIDLPVTRLQFSKLKTNSVSFYEVGPLECFGKAIYSTPSPSVLTSGTARATTALKSNENPTLSSKGLKSTTSKLLSTKWAAQTSEKIVTTSNLVPQSFSKVMTRFTSSLLPKPTKAPQNTTYTMPVYISSKAETKMTKTPTVKGGSGQIIVINQPDKNGGGLLSDQMLLLTVLTSVLILVAVAVILVLLRQRLHCCASDRRLEATKKVEVDMSVQEDEGSGNNNFNELLETSRACPSNVTVDLEELDNIRIMIPLRYQSSSSIASSSMADTSRYLDIDGESDSVSITSGRLRDPLHTIPKRGILKSRNLLSHKSRQKCSADDVYLLKQCGNEESGIESKTENTNTVGTDRLIYQSNADCDFTDLGSISSITSIRKHSPLYVQCQASDSSSESVEKQQLDFENDMNDAGSSSSHSCRSYGSLGSDESIEESIERTFHKKNRDLDRSLKRSVRFSLHEGYVEYEPCDKAEILRKATMSADIASTDCMPTS